MARVSTETGRMYPQIQELTQDVASLTQDMQVERYLKCVYDPLEFFKYVQTKDSNTNRILSHPLWPSARLLILNVTQKKYKRNILLKSRQIMASWTMAGLHLWMCHKVASNVLCFSKGETEATDLVDKSRFINNQMPEWLRLKTPQESTTGMMMTFPDTMSRIKAFPSTATAGVGETASHVTRDELDFHEYAEENFGHVSPTIDKGEATILDQSASRRVNPTSHFKETYRKAKRGENNYHPMFFPWSVDPSRTWEWYYQTIKNYQPQWLGEANYPCTEEDALGGVEGMGLFDKSAIDRLLNNVRDPIQTQGVASIYVMPNPKNHYLCGADIAEGRGHDYSVIWIEEKSMQGRQLAAIMRTNQLPPPLFAIQAANLLRQYGNPQVVCGADAWGVMFLEALNDLHYHNIFRSKPDKLGFIESSENKQQNLLAFAMAVTNGYMIPYKQAITEMFGWNVDEKNRYFSTGAYDDCISAASKAQFAHDRMPNPNEKIKVWF